MADTTTRSDELIIDNLFIDGDTRQIKLKNPKEEIEESEIAALNTQILNGGTSTLLIGDRTGSLFRRINKVTRRKTTTTNLDLSDS